MNNNTGSKKHRSINQGLISTLDLNGYTGQRGQIIRLKPHGDHRTQQVRVVLRDVLGVAFEEGFAIWDDTAGTWAYLTTTQAPPDEIILVTAFTSNPTDPSVREAAWIHVDLRRPINFETEEKAADLGRWKDN